MNLVGSGKNKKALDAGCREGKQTRALERKGYKVTSIDISKEYEKCRIVDLNKKLPFKDNSFDLIWCSEVIEHLKSPEFTVNEFRRVLRKGGKMVLTTPNSYCWIFKFLYLFGLTPKQLQREDHTYFFNEKQIRRLFPKARVYGFFPYFLIKKKIAKSVGLLSPTFVIEERK